MTLCLFDLLTFDLATTLTMFLFWAAGNHHFSGSYCGRHFLRGEGQPEWNTEQVGEPFLSQHLKSISEWDVKVIWFRLICRLKLMVSHGAEQRQCLPVKVRLVNDSALGERCYNRIMHTYTLRFKRLGSLRNVLVFERKEKKIVH